MSYTKEMCLYLLDNPDNIEAESLTQCVKRQVFQAMNKAISMRVGDRTPWRGQYALVTGDDEEHEETWFACAHCRTKPTVIPSCAFGCGRTGEGRLPAEAVVEERGGACRFTRLLFFFPAQRTLKRCS